MRSALAVNSHLTLALWEVHEVVNAHQVALHSAYLAATGLSEGALKAIQVFRYVRASAIRVLVLLLIQAISARLDCRSIVKFNVLDAVEVLHQYIICHSSLVFELKKYHFPHLRHILRHVVMGH